MRLLAGTPYDRPPTCDRCGKPESDCNCPPIHLPKVAATSDRKTIRLAIEKRKKGKMVTVIGGLWARQNDLPALLSKLKSRCGAGGSLDGDTIEVQGDHLDRLRTLLAEAGFVVRG